MKRPERAPRIKMPPAAEPIAIPTLTPVSIPDGGATAEALPDEVGVADGGSVGGGLVGPEDVSVAVDERPVLVLEGESGGAV